MLEGITAELEAAGVESPRLEAERLVSHVLGVTRSELLLRLEESVDAEHAGALAVATGRRLAGIPLQHIEGSVSFRTLTLVCDSRALVPRPETEQLVDLVADWAADRASTTAGVVRVRRPGGAESRLESALDIGTGSGAIALSLLAEGIASRVTGIDVSTDALEQARENRRIAGLDDQLELRLVSRSPWEVVRPDECFDLIVSNPPYVPDDDIPGLAPEVRDHEPRTALAGGPDGLDLVRAIAGEARSHLLPHGAFFLEIGAGQGAAAAEIVASHGPWHSVEIRRDLAGHDRFVVALAAAPGTTVDRSRAL